MSFSLICDKCKSLDCWIDTIDNGEFIEVSFICENCNHKSTTYNQDENKNN